MTNPVDLPELYEHILLRGSMSPGVCEVSGADREYKWDTPQAKGTSGAAAVFQGKDQADFTVKIFLWKEFGEGKTDHFAEWETFKGVLDGMMVDGKPEAADIYHPALEANGIRAVLLKHVGQLIPEGKGLYSVTIEFLEYREPKKSGGTPGGAKTGSPSAAEKAGADAGSAAGAAALLGNKTVESYTDEAFDE